MAGVIYGLPLGAILAGYVYRRADQEHANARLWDERRESGLINGKAQLIGPTDCIGRDDSVIISAGGTLPTDSLRRIGITVETKYGSA